MMDALAQHVADLIRTKRIELKLSQGEMAKLIGTTRQSVNGYEKGRFLPQMQIMLKLAKVLSLDLNALKEI